MVLVPNSTSVSGRVQSFTVFIARKSGNRSRLQPVPRPARLMAWRTAIQVYRLAVIGKARRTPELELAQLALRRCLYLTRELGRLHHSAPEAAIMVARSIIETALAGSYLSIHGAGGAQRMMKKQSGAARRLRDRFLAGDPLGALALLTEIDLIATPLSPTLANVQKTENFDQICRELDKHPPFSSGALATLLYEESYSLFSNHVEHPTPQSLRRHARRVISLGGHGPRLFRPTKLAPQNTIDHVVLPAIGALCSCITRSIGKPYALLDQWTSEAAGADGYLWTGSPARTLAASELAHLAGLPSLRTLNWYGLSVRAIGMLDVMLQSSDADQLVIACELLDRSRKFPYLLTVILPKIWPKSILSRLRTTDQAETIAKGNATDHPQALLAALALVYAGLWPDDSKLLTTRLEAFDASAPYPTGLLDQLVRSVAPSDVKRLRARHRSQILRMP